LVRDLRPGDRDGNPQEMHSHGDVLYFAAEDGEHGLELWRWSDSTGVQMVADIDEGSMGSDPHALISYDEEWVYFAARTQRYGVELWRSNGNVTEMLRDTWPSSFGSTPNDFVVFGDKLCYSAADEPHGRELWCLVHANAEPIITRERTDP